MITRLKSGAGRLLLLAALIFITSGAVRAHAAQIDLNGNGMSDIWEFIFGASSLGPNDDTDADGVINRLESVAGTDPFDLNSAPLISSFTYTATNFSVSMASALGKKYELQSSLDLGGHGTNWSVEASAVARVGTIVTLSAPIGFAPKFFRFAVSDVDTDNDGVNDWEEYKLGLDPMQAYSNGQLDGNGQPMNDYAYAVGRLSSQSVVTLTATDPTANQPDPGQSAINSGLFTVTRGGFPLTGITVSLSLAGPGAGFANENVDHLALPRSLIFPPGLSSKTISVTPLANTNLLAPVIAMMKLLPGGGYTIGTASNASIVIYPSATPTGTGLTGQYYTNASATYSSNANFNAANLKLTRVDTNVDFTWGTTSVPITNNGWYTVRWTGQVQPQYSQTYYFVANTDDGVKLWVNDQLVINNWSTKSASDVTGTIDLVGGVRYNIKMEYFQATGGAVAHLSWYSADQAKQVIPMSRLYPSSVPAAPAAVTSPLSAVAFLGQPFTFTVTGANSASNYTANGLPPDLSFNGTSGVISGIPTLAGDFEVAVTASNSVGLGASVVDIQVLDTGSAVTREVWTGVSGVNVSDIPVSSPASITNFLGTLETTTNYGDNYGERIRGFLTAPATANFYFYLAGSDAAELWISNDSEPVNKVRRASITAGNGTAPRQWSLQPKQKSGWLALVAGQRYYLEILHKAGVGTNDNLAVGWLQDATGTNTLADGVGVVPGYVLSKYFPVPPASIPGTLYSANMLAAAGVVSSGIGSATLRLSGDGSQAVLNYSLTGLNSTHVDHIKNDPYLNNAVQVMFDISAASPQPDGSYIWNIMDTGTLTAADIREILNEGKAFINIETPAHNDGEISGHFTTANGSPTFTPPPPPPVWTDDHSNYQAASRFLIQATFGPSASEINNVQTQGYSNWINTQMSMPVTHHLPNVFATASWDPNNLFPSALTFNTWWQYSVTAPDQLRQRVAFALSEILVASEAGVLQDRATALSYYYDTLLDNAFGNFRSLLKAVTLTPAMGLYLDMRGNDKGNLATGYHANENYGREIMQLFSLGLNRMWPDGTLITDSLGNLVPTYDQNVILGMASVFTGWNYYQPNQTNGHLPASFSPSANYTNPMVLVPTHHDLNAKRVLDNVVLPAAWGNQTFSTNVEFDAYGQQDLELALNSIFDNQNVGPFVCRQLIQRLVTSNPSREYLYRVVQQFNDNGSGVRGDLAAVVKAILLDYEARSADRISLATFGKQREPLLRVTAAARAFLPGPPMTGTYSQTGSRTITVTSASPHRLNNNDTVYLNFTDTSSNSPPTSQGYVVTVTSPTMFTLSATGLVTATYVQSPTTTITNAAATNTFVTNGITVTLASHGLTVGSLVYLVFNSGAAVNGAYSVTNVVDSSHFIALTTNSTTTSGNCLFPKYNGGGFSQIGTNITFTTAGNHALNPGDTVYVVFPAGTVSLANGQYPVVSVPDPVHFTTTASISVTQTVSNPTLYPLVMPPVVRSGNVSVQQSTWAMGYTDTSSSANISQSPLRSPTVFNFFLPDFKFPGALASAGLTTPEFQLTSDTGVALAMNFLEGSILNNGNNTNGLSSFTGGNGAIVLDIGPWMTTNYTANAGLPGLVDGLNSLLLAGQLSPSAKNYIVNYASTLGYTSPNPTYTQMRDRVRAAVHLLLTSPDFTIQK
jgi:uncharacterized protein (DUF1800 family)